MTLKFVLKPGERFVVNGALFQNGDRKSALLLHNHAWLVRDKEFLSSEEAATPAGRRYMRILQLIMAPAGPGESQEEISRLFATFVQELDSAEEIMICSETIRLWNEGDYYAALRKFRPLCSGRPQQDRALPAAAEAKRA